MPLAPRPLSLLSSLKFKTRKETADEPTYEKPASGPVTPARPPPTAALGTTRTKTTTNTNAMPPSHSLSRMAQYARGSSDSNIPQQQGISKPHPSLPRDDATYYPPTSNPISRHAIAESARLPLPKGSPQRTPASHLRQPSISSMPPLGSPPAHSLPHPPSNEHGASRRRTNSIERVGALWSPSLPSNIGTPFDSPEIKPDSRVEKQYPQRDNSIRQPTRNFAGSQRATNDLAPFVLTDDGSMNVVQPGFGSKTLHQHRGTSGDAPEVALGARGYSSEHGFSSSPNGHHTKLPIHDANLRKSYVGQSAAPSREDNGRASSPTLDHTARTLFRNQGERPRDPQRSTIFQEDDEYDGDLRSDYPMSDDDRGTPRPIIKKHTSNPERFLSGSPQFVSGTRAGRELARGKKRNRNNLDYEDQDLMKMDYTDLQNQPFDVDPIQGANSTGIGIGNNGARRVLAGEGLPEALEFYKGKREPEQKQFFAQMSLEDWERSGDWFLEQFGRVTQRLKEARQHKRELAAAFETEIANREEAVRLRTEGINKKLNKIKHKGEDMLADKEV